MWIANKWMKIFSRTMILNMVWLTGPAAWAEPVQTASLTNSATEPQTHRSLDSPDGSVAGDALGYLTGGGPVHQAVREAVRNYPRERNRQYPEKNTVWANAANFGGFVITYSAVLAGFLVLYAPLGSYGAAKCLFHRDGWNDCWNAYMIRTFH